MAKQNYIKRVLAGTFALIMVAGYLPGKINKDGSLCITASAETLSGVIDDINWEFTDDGTLTLSPGKSTEISGRFCTDLHDNDLINVEKIEKVVFKNGITKIDEAAFGDSNIDTSNIKEADFSECTTLESIGDAAFEVTNISTFDFSACKSLKTLNMVSLASNNLSEVRLGISDPSDIEIDETAFGFDSSNDVKIVVPYGSADAWAIVNGSLGSNTIDNIWGAKSVTFKDATIAGVHKNVNWEFDRVGNGWGSRH